MKYLTYYEVRTAEIEIGKKLLSLDEITIDYIKENYIANSGGFEQEESIQNLKWDLHNCGILGLYWKMETLCMAEEVISAFYKRLKREKYYRQGRIEILTTCNNGWQRNRRTWKKLVFERDKYTCAECGINRNLQAHHIKLVSENPEFEFDVDNGITLCKACHLKKHPNIGLLK